MEKVWGAVYREGPLGCQCAGFFGDRSGGSWRLQEANRGRKPAWVDPALVKDGCRHQPLGSGPIGHTSLPHAALVSFWALLGQHLSALPS